MSNFTISEYMKLDEKNQTLEILKPEENMQTDCACFESVALIAKCYNKILHLRIIFEPLNWSGKFRNLLTEQAHYMRFLYRLFRFTQEYDWCYVEGKEKKEIERFEKALASITPINNVPGTKAEFNPNGKKEHIVENMFCSKNGTEYLSKLLKKAEHSPLKFIDHQLPNGLFTDNVSEINRIFTTGYFDLWGINENNELCLFELKIDENTKMGIISELYFYTEYTSQFLLSKSINPKRTKFRSYDKLLNHAKEDNGSKKVNAYFLVGGKMHPELEKNEKRLLELLNINPLRCYNVLNYDPEHPSLQYKP